MKKYLPLLAAIALLLVGCATKSDIESLQQQINNLTNTQIATINMQVANIQKSIGDLSEVDRELKGLITGLREDLEELDGELDTKYQEITQALDALENEDALLDQRIKDLKTYCDQQDSGVKNWATTTFATLEQHSAVLTEMAGIKTRLGELTQMISDLDTSLSQKVSDVEGRLNAAIASSESSVKAWVNEKLADYYTIAQIEAKLKILEDGYKEGDESLSTEISTLRSSLETAKTELTTAYQTAVAAAIEQNNGVINAKIAADIKTASDALRAQIDEMKGRLDSIESRLLSLEASVAELIGMVQSIVVVPDYSDGSVRISNTTDNTIRFEVYPLTAAAAIAEKGTSIFTLDYVETTTKANGILANLPITAVSFTDELLVLSVDGSGLPESVLSGSISANARLKISDGNMTKSSAYFRLTYWEDKGIRTVADLLNFAMAVNAGESMADWVSDGAVMLKADIDMAELTINWDGIGTEEHPFTGKFNGNGHSILNLKKAKAGFFHFCKDASISNLIIGTGSTMSLSGSFDEQVAWGGIADKAENSTFSCCTYSGAIEFEQSSSGEAYIGGILGKGDASTRVLSCRTDGTITLSSDSTSMTIYAGGIAGEAGTVSRNEFSGEIKCLTGAICRIAGIIPSLGENNKVTDNSFLGTLTLNGSSVNMKVGGLYAEIEGTRAFDEASDKSVVSGTIDILKFGTSTSAHHYVGGMVGYLGGDAYLNIAGYTSQTNINLNYAEDRVAQYLCIGGFLGGCDLEAPVSGIAMDGVINQGTVSIKYDTRTWISVRRTCVGGMAGLLNGPATFKNCVNQAELGAKTGGDYSAKSNAFSVIMGGIAGLGFGGNMEFEKCSNLFPLTNNFYSNHWLESYSGELRTTPATGGMIGAFNYNKTFQEMHLKISNCTSRGNMTACRGFFGGMVGFAYDAEISNCSWEGNSAWTSDVMANQAPYKGGIAGVLGKGSISGCTVRGDIYASMAGSAESADGGGILARAYGSEDVTVTGCSYFGNMESRSTTSTPVVSQLGGIVGCATEKTMIATCKFGGSIKSIPISANNLSEMVVGAGTPAWITGLTYWDGN
jgi:hypothetical protein